MRHIPTAIVALAFSAAAATGAQDWTEPVEVLHDGKRCLSYRARLAGEFLVIEAAMEPTWHTFAMDNKRRQDEKLAGKPSLGIERSTEIRVNGGLEAISPWFQSLPKDLSKPEIRWFTWGFEQQGLFVTKIKRSGPATAQIGIRGQACSEAICKNIDVTISIAVTPPKTAGADIDWKALEQVR